MVSQLRTRRGGSALDRKTIALLTDFGSSGPYVGAMKAVILGINADAILLDITHQVGPQAVEEGAFLLSTVIPYLPEGSICVAVVDPGVGTERAAVALRTAHHIFVGPDNGLLSAALSDEQRQPSPQPGQLAELPCPPDIEAVHLHNPEYFRHPVSTTFHGRDIFAPVGAHLSRGIELARLGPAAATLLVYPPWRRRARKDGAIEGRVVYANHFGNIITDIRSTDLSGRRIRLSVAGREFEGLQRSFQEGPEYVVYIGSGGYLELARRNGNAATALGVKAGEHVEVHPIV
ncbi:MAG: SAM hydrolase/SAM-dependent halogenase family protein [Dehalococcoidia bacterium]